MYEKKESVAKNKYNDVNVIHYMIKTTSTIYSYLNT